MIGVICSGGAIDVFLVADSYSAACFVGAVPVCDLVAVAGCQQEADWWKSRKLRADVRGTTGGEKRAGNE